MSETPTLPLIVLAGSDSEPAQLPESGADKHPLKGPKGLQVELGGRPLIDRITERLAEVGSFGPIFIAGPRSAYGASRHGIEVIDTDGSFGRNIQAAVQVVRGRYPEGPMGVTVCDILPSLEELQTMMADYEAHRPLDFWVPMILAPTEPEKLGASAWKPQYRVSPAEGEPAQPVLPGHFVVGDIEGVRLGFILRSFEAAYRSRNRPLTYRYFSIVGDLLRYLLGKDLQQIRHLRIPGVTATVVYQAAVLVSRLRRGKITNEEMAQRLHRIFFRSEHRSAHPERHGRLPIIAALGFAKDIDTREEAEEAARRFPDGGERHHLEEQDQGESE